MSTEVLCEGVQSARWGMGTVIAQQVFGGRAREALRAAEDEVARLEALLSRFRPESEVSEVNRRAGNGDVRLSAETYRVLSLAIEYAAITEGRFDVTIGPLLAVWQRAKEESRAPRASDVERALSLVDLSGLRLDPPTRTAALRRPGQSVDLGGIGKGFAAERVLEVYRARGVTSAFVNLGGNVAALGARPDGSPWRVGIRHPRREDELLGLVCVADRSVVTSGDYERGFTDAEGRYHHHILDPGTGYPAESGLSSVTIVAEDSTAADVLSTAVFVAGLPRGLALLDAFPGTEAVLVDAASRVHVTRGLQGSFQAARSVEVAITGTEEVPTCPRKAGRSTGY